MLPKSRAKRPACMIALPVMFPTCCTLTSKMLTYAGAYTKYKKQKTKGRKNWVQVEILVELGEKQIQNSAI